MSVYKNILIEAPLEGEEYERLFCLKDNPLITNAEHINLVNVFNSGEENHLPKDMDCKDLDQVEYIIKEKLDKLKEIIDPEEKLNWEIKVIFDKEAKNACVFYSREIKADLIIVPTRGIGQSHIQNESFAQYMLESTSADLLVLKPR